MRRRILPVAVAAVFILGACGSDTEAAPPAAPATDVTAPAEFPVVVRGVEIPAKPERIVSLSATHTEILYALGAGPSIVATDLFSDYPEEASLTDKVDAFNLSVEAVAEFDPDLVILSFDPGDAVTGFEALGIPAVLFPPPGPTDLDGVYAEIRDVGLASGFGDDAGQLVAEIQVDISEVVSRVPEGDPQSFYFELDPTLFSAGEGTLIDHVMSLLGLENIAQSSDGPFPQFSAEYLIGANPDFVFLADTLCCGQSAETVSQRPGWSEMSAVTEDRIVELDDGVASRWGPRLVDLMRVIAGEVYPTG